MNLISQQTSWDKINSAIQNNIFQEITDFSLSNFKNFLICHSPKQVFYIDSIGPNDCITFLYGTEANAYEYQNLTFILKNTVTSICNEFYFSTGSVNRAKSTIVFKHNISELQTLLTNTQTNNAISVLLNEYNLFMVPTGLKTDYITAFDSFGNTYWNNLTAEEKSALITEGSEEYEA